MRNPHAVTEEFEQALCEYTGAQYAVAVNSCTMALLLAVAWHLRMPRVWLEKVRGIMYAKDETLPEFNMRVQVEIPKRTYVGVPMSIIHAGGQPVFRDERWVGAYQLKPLPVWDSARWFTSGMYSGDGRPVIGPAPHHFAIFGPGQMACVSFHWSKTLGIQQGGAILHDSPEADLWLRRARFDGRTPGVPPAKDTFDQIGWHCYMSPEVAAEGLVRLSFLPKYNAPLHSDDYPDLSLHEVFK